MLPATLALVFGGCCTNALSLQQLTGEHPDIGHLITVAQFLFISVYSVFRNVTFTTRSLPRLKKRRIPIYPYLAQVALFYFISLLNNAAFTFHIPMNVHIIFRSAGLVISMLLGWMIAGKRYTPLQVASVIVVSVGVTFTTLSASDSPTMDDTQDFTPQRSEYTIGVGILTLALLLSGFLGLVQDWTYSKYGRTPKREGTSSFAPAHQESMFYLHVLSLPLFIPIRHRILTQLNILQGGPCRRTSIDNFCIPSGFLPLLVNVLTQLLCVSGVHRLTMSYSALTVTLILVVRKAASLVLSVYLFGERTTSMMWLGALLVLLGTAAYSADTAQGDKIRGRKDKTS